MNIFKSIQQAARPVSAAPFVSFRIVFGLLMAFSTLRFVWLGWIEDHYSEPLFHFHYYGFSWIEPLSTPALYVVHLLMLLAALGVATGYFYRISALVLFISFTYTELIDLTYYLNHYYFVSIICFWLIFMPEPGADFKLPAWCRWLIMFQLGLVYLYAGLAKINHAWLIEAMPLRIWLPAHDDLPLLGSLLAMPETAWVFSWGGMLYDCSIPFLLLYRKTRSLAYLLVVVFHIITGLLFQIGVFPLVMIGATIIFFSTEWHHRFLALVGQIPLVGKAFKISASQDTSGESRNYLPLWLKALLTVHILFQLVFPWRYLVYPGNLFWTEEGYRFSWRVMLVEKAGDAAFFVKDSQTGREGLVNNREFLNAHQEKQMSFQPDMILQFAHFLGNYYKSKGVHEPQVRAEVYVTMNAQKSRLLIDSQLDLMKIQDGWAPKKWILPWQP